MGSLGISFCLTKPSRRKQMAWHTAQAAIGPMTLRDQLWNKHRFQDQHELLSAWCHPGDLSFPMPTTTTGTEASWFLTVYETEILDANDSSTEPQNPGKPEWQTEQRQVFPSTEAQCLCEGKVFPFCLCYTEIPHSRFTDPSFCYLFGDFSNSEKLGTNL